MLLQPRKRTLRSLNQDVRAHRYTWKNFTAPHILLNQRVLALPSLLKSSASDSCSSLHPTLSYRRRCFLSCAFFSRPRLGLRSGSGGETARPICCTSGDGCSREGVWYAKSITLCLSSLTPLRPLSCSLRCSVRYSFGKEGEVEEICVCVRASMFVVLDTLLRGAEWEGERDALRLSGWRGRRVSVLVSVVEAVELLHEASRRALRRDVLRQSARRMLSRKSTGEVLVRRLSRRLTRGCRVLCKYRGGRRTSDEA